MNTYQTAETKTQPPKRVRDGAPDDTVFLGGDKLLRIREAAVHLRVSEKSIRRFITEGKLASVKLGGLRLIRASDLNALVQRCIDPTTR